MTLEPSLLYTCPSSRPITPPPITTKCFGTSFNFRASVEEIILSPSKSTNGNLVGLLPVAIIIFLPFITSDLPLFLTSTVVESLNEPNPLKTVTLFLFIKYSSPFVVCSTTDDFLDIILSRSSLILPSIEIPWSSKL